MAREFGIGQVVSARNRLWRIEQVVSQQSTFEQGTTLNLLQVSSIDEWHRFELFWK